MTRKQDQLLFWGRYVAKNWRLAPFIAAGAGFMSETVETRFGVDERSDTGQPQGVMAIAVGAITPLSKWLELSMEGRAESSPATAPHVIFGLSLFAAAKF